jgi:hypothetical protein
MNKIYFFFLMIFFSSCLPKISYLGNSYSPTKEPDFYVDEKSIERPYKIIGKGYPERFGLYPLEVLQRKALTKAKDKGADAILIQDYFIQNTVATVNSIYRTDSLGKGLITTGSSVLSNGNSDYTRFIVLFLKYTDH